MVSGHLLGLLDEAVHHTDTTVIDEKHQARGALTWQRGANFLQATTQGPAERHANRPPKLDRGQVSADRASVVRRKASQPIENRFRATCRSIEKRGYFRQALGRHSDPFPGICII